MTLRYLQTQRIVAHILSVPHTPSFLQTRFVAPSFTSLLSHTPTPSPPLPPVVPFYPLSLTYPSRLPFP